MITTDSEDVGNECNNFMPSPGNIRTFEYTFVVVVLMVVVAKVFSDMALILLLMSSILSSVLLLLYQVYPCQ